MIHQRIWLMYRRGSAASLACTRQYSYTYLHACTETVERAESTHVSEQVSHSLGHVAVTTVLPCLPVNNRTKHALNTYQMHV